MHTRLRKAYFFIAMPLAFVGYFLGVILTPIFIGLRGAYREIEKQLDLILAEEKKKKMLHLWAKEKADEVIDRTESGA